MHARLSVSASHIPENNARDFAGALPEPGADTLPGHAGIRLLLVLPWIHMYRIPNDVIACGRKGATRERQMLPPAEVYEVS